MTPADVQELFQNRLGLRLGKAMAEYVLNRFEAGGVPTIAVIAADVRTGVPLRMSVDTNTLSSESPRTVQPLVAEPTLLTFIP